MASSMSITSITGIATPIIPYQAWNFRCIDCGETLVAAHEDRDLPLHEAIAGILSAGWHYVAARVALAPAALGEPPLLAEDDTSDDGAGWRCPFCALGHLGGTATPRSTRRLRLASDA